MQSSKIRNGRGSYGMRQTRRGLMLMTGLLLSGCAQVGTSETEATICRELRRDLPTYSTRDTPETLDAGAQFLDVFAAVCG